MVFCEILKLNSGLFWFDCGCLDLCFVFYFVGYCLVDCYSVFGLCDCFGVDFDCYWFKVYLCMD